MFNHKGLAIQHMNGVSFAVTHAIEEEYFKGYAAVSAPLLPEHQLEVFSPRLAVFVGSPPVSVCFHHGDPHLTLAPALWDGFVADGQVDILISTVLAGAQVEEALPAPITRALEEGL
jgi:hypothetical protein